MIRFCSYYSEYLQEMSIFDLALPRSLILYYFPFLYFQNAFPFRISSFVVYNSNKVLENIINIAKTFIPKKLTNRVSYHK